MLKWRRKKWALNDPLPSHADAVVAISYGATSKELTNGSSHVMKEAKILAETYPDCLLLWGTFSKDSNRSTEYELKSMLLPERSVYIGDVSSSTDECEGAKSNIEMFARSTKSIIVVCEGAHSRRCKLVWKHFLPESNLCFRSIPAWQCADERNPMALQRNGRVWLLTNIVLYPFYRWWPGVAWFAKKNFSQPISR